MCEIIIYRRYTKSETLGRGEVVDADGFNIFDFRTLELPDKGNARRVSCIPEARYKLVKMNNNKFGRHFDIKDVPGRDGIKIHAANYVRQLLGCIAVGARHLDIDGDGIVDLSNSRQTLDRIWEIMPDESFIEIAHFD